MPVVRTPARGNGEGPAPQAWLVAVKDRGSLGEFDRLVLHQAVTVVALELLRRRVADDTERRLAGDVLASLVSGELPAASSPAGSSRSGWTSASACSSSRRRAGEGAVEAG